MGAICSFSLVTTSSNNNQLTQNAYCILTFEVVFTDHRIAIKDNTKNNRSNIPHHAGCSLLSISIPEWVIKIKGVARQCIKHKLLARIPRVSDFWAMFDMFKSKSVYNKLQR